MSTFKSAVAVADKITFVDRKNDEDVIVLFNSQLYPIETKGPSYLQLARKVSYPSKDDEPNLQDPLTNLENEEFQSALIGALEIEQEEFDGHLNTLKEAITAADATFAAAEEEKKSKNAVEKARRAANGAKYNAFVVFVKAIISDDEKLKKFLEMTKDNLGDASKCTQYFSIFKFIFAAIVDAHKAAAAQKTKVSYFTYRAVAKAIADAGLPFKPSNGKKSKKSDEDSEDAEEKAENEGTEDGEGKAKPSKPKMFVRILKWFITLDIIQNRVTKENIKQLHKQENKKNGNWAAYHLLQIRFTYGMAPAPKTPLQAPLGLPVGITLGKAQREAKLAADKVRAQAEREAAKAKKAKNGKGKGGKPGRGKPRKNNKSKKVKKSKDDEAKEEKKDEDKAEETEPAADEAEADADAAKEEPADDDEGSGDDDDGDDDEEDGEEEE